MSLRKRTTKGIAFKKISILSQAIVEFAVTATLAKLLVPADFGLISIASLFTIFISRINELGLGHALIQKKELTYEEISTSFWLNIGSGVAFFLLMLLLAGQAEAFFGMEGLAGVLMVLSINMIISALSVIPRTLLEKELEFKKISKYEIASVVIFSVVSITLALLKFGVYSIAFGRVVQKFCMLTLLRRQSNFTPSFTFNFSKFRGLFNFGVYVMLQEIAGFLFNNVDYLVIGKLVGATMLGYYTIAFQIAILPSQRLNNAILAVVYPTFCKLQDDNERLQSGFLKIVKYISLIIYPVLMGFFAVADIFIIVILGEKWVLSILPAQILAISCVIRAIGAPIASVYKSKGRPDISLKFNTGNFLVTLALILGFVRFGIVGVAIAMLISSAIAHIIAQHICNGMIGLKFGEHFANLKLSFFASTAMSASVIALKHLLRANTGIEGAWLLAILVPCGVVVYLLMLYIIDRDIFREAKEIYKEVTG